MNVPTADEIESEFRMLDEDYDEVEFYGGAFEGSHWAHDLVVLRLYSVVPGDGDDRLRIETRHHYGGRIVDHCRAEWELDDDGTVTGRSLREFCHDHHFDDPREELRSLVEQVAEESESTP